MPTEARRSFSVTSELEPERAKQLTTPHPSHAIDARDGIGHSKLREVRIPTNLQRPFPERAVLRRAELPDITCKLYRPRRRKPLAHLIGSCPRRAPQPCHRLRIGLRRSNQEDQILRADLKSAVNAWEREAE